MDFSRIDLDDATQQFWTEVQEFCDEYVTAEVIDEEFRSGGGFDERLHQALDVELLGPIIEMGLGPVVVGRALAAPGPDFLARAGRRGVGDPGRLLLAVPLAPQRAVRLLVLDLSSGHTWPPPVSDALYPILSRQTSERGAAEGGHLLIEFAGRRRAAEDRLGQLGPQGG